MIENLDEHIVNFGRNCIKNNPKIIVGSGASVPFGLPSMSDLSDIIIDNPPLDHKSELKDNWEEFIQTLIEEKNLEKALTKVNLNELNNSHLLKLVWSTINNIDRSLLNREVQKFNRFPLSRLFEYIIISTHKQIDLITTNYDRIAEYSADYANLPFFKGLEGCYHQKFNFSKGRNSTKTVNIWKVHGCLDWFQDMDETNFGIPYLSEIPKNLKPLIVTPGIGKHETTHKIPFREIIRNVDDVIDRSFNFFCVGYGFNDSHIHEKLKTKLLNERKSQIVILSKQITEETQKILQKSNCKFLACEEAQNGAKIYSDTNKNGQIIEKHIWKFDEFLDFVIG